MWVLAYMGRGKVNELGVCVSMSLLICHCISHVGFCGVRVLASPPFPPPPWGFAMRSSLSFASSCRDDACSPLRVCHLGWSVTGSLFALCGGAGRLRGCPSDGRGSEDESDWV